MSFSREPILRSPPIVLLLCAALLLIYIALALAPPPVQLQLIQHLAFYPDRLGQGIGSFITLISYAFLHGNWEHILLNLFWLLAFATPVATRLESNIRFILFFFLCSVLAGLTHYMFHLASDVPVIGASGGVAGMLGAAARFALHSTNWLNPATLITGARRKEPLLPLRAVVKNRTVLFFILLWLGLNVLFGVIAFSPSGYEVQIAWQAHIGGFLAGLFLLPYIEKPPVSPSGGPGYVDYGRWRDGAGD